MAEYLAKRLILAAITLLVILFTSYVLLRLAPGDPTRSTLLGDSGIGNALNAEKQELRSNAALRERLHLDRPIAVGFGFWMRDVLHGDFGTSAAVAPGRPVTELIRERLPVTLMLNISAVLLTYLLAIPLGVHTALHAGQWSDNTSSFLLFVLYSLPVMWVGLMLQAVLCEGGIWPLFPLKSLEPAGADKLSIWRVQWELLRTYALPVWCLTYGGLAGLSRYTRNGMLEIIRADFVRTARAKGLPEMQVIWGHAFRNALVTLITLFGGLLPSLVAGSVLVEYIFNVPGMGNLSLLALSSRDYPLQMALFAFSGALTLAGILLADLLYAAADPRIKLSK